MFCCREGSLLLPLNRTGENQVLVAEKHRALSLHCFIHIGKVFVIDSGLMGAA